jgi:transcription elongation factor GreA
LFVGILFCFTYTLNLIIKIKGGKEIMAYMSEEGYKKLMAELKQLEGVERPHISAQIAEARDKGDLSENAEYDAAKEAQGMLEMRINKLKTTIADAKIIDESKLKTDSVQILNKVELKNVANGMKMTYTIVSESEADLKLGKISVNTPIAQGLLGKKVGDVAEIKIPKGIIKLEVVNISI